MMTEKKRPGVYRSIENRGRASTIVYIPPVEDDEPEVTEVTLLKDRSGMLLKTSDGYYLAVRS